MPGNVVPLYLCKTCKGLFVFESQAENHEVKCDGDAFKSPANLFVCEREHYLELIAPTPTVADTKSNKKRLLCERKRRKTSPQINTTPESRAPRKSFLSKDDLSTLTPGTYYGMVNPQIWDADRKSTISQSVSQPDITCQQNSINLNSIQYSTTSSKIVQSSSQQNVLNAVVSLTSPASQSFMLTSEDISEVPGWISPSKPDVRFTSNSSLPRADLRQFASVDDSVLLQKNSTPATNLLAYLGQLQQDKKPGTPSILQNGDEVPVPRLLQRSVSVDDHSELYVVLDREPVEGGSIQQSAVSLHSSLPTLQHSATVQQHSTLTTTADGHVSILAEDILELDDFQFKAMTPVTQAESVPTASQLLDDTVDSQMIHDFLSFGSNAGGEDDKKSQISMSVETSYHAQTATQCYSNPSSASNDSSMPLRDDQQDMKTGEGTEMIQSFKTESSNSSSVPIFEEKSEVNNVSHTPQDQETSVPGSVVLFLEPDGPFLQTMSVENMLDNAINGSAISNAMSVPSGMSTEDIVQQCNTNNLQVQVCESAGQTSTESLTTCQTTSVSFINPDSYIDLSAMNGQDTVGFVRSSKAVTKTKSKNQQRLEELSALREEVLQQATEIPLDGESKKCHFRCNVCGHVAKSVKFMHNHLQMHADGKVHFECDQCDFKSRLRSKLAEHQQRHSRSRLLCHLCPATFMDNASLNRHVSAKHSDKDDLKCDQCDFKANYPSLLREHMLKHTGDLLCCDVEGCGYKTPYLRALRVHQKRHMSEKNYRCHLCRYEAVEKSTLDRHIKSHTQERPYQCSSCDFRANTRYGVVFHMQHKHQPQKSFYACDKCSFYTTYASSISKHLKTHQNNFTCPLCNHSTGTLASIKKHLHQVHQVVHMEVLQSKTKISAKDYLHTQPDPAVLAPSNKHPTPPTTHLTPPNKPLTPDPLASTGKDLLPSNNNDLMPADKELMTSEKALMDSLMADTMSMESQDLPMTDGDRSRIDPMKLSFHFHDPSQGQSGLNLTRSSSIPDLYTFSGLHRSNSQTDLLTFPGINTMTRSNSMSDLVSFASTVCLDGGEAVTMDVSLSEASAPPMEVGGLALGEDSAEGSLSEEVRLGSLGGVLLALQCSKCLALLMNEEDVDTHKKNCTGTVLMV